MFIEPENGDLRINGFYPCANNGLNDYNSTSTDVRGQTRIQNTIIDMGAYEWTEGVDPAFHVIYVDILASGNNDGSRWTDAYTSLQSALDETSSGNQVWVAKGTYKPSSAYDLTNTSRFYHFRMIEGVEIYGGFSGTENSKSQRKNFGLGDENETLLSGDLNGDDVVSGSGITLELANYSENCYHVIYNPDPLTSSSILNGFTIKGGNANASGVNPHDRGSGIYNSTASPSLSNLTVIYNGGIYGGGIYNLSASPTITNCLIYGNKTQNGAGTENKTSSPTYINTTIAMNLATDYGGGMNNYNNSDPIFNNCILWGNNATTGNQIYASAGGTTTLNYSCYSNQSNDIVMSSTTFTADNNNITDDPEFINATSGDLRLFGISPAVNTGLNNYNTTSTDVRGLTRIQNTTIDMGAYEWTYSIDPYTNTGILYVDVNAVGVNNGANWANAFSSIQSTLDVAYSGYQIWVAKGTYNPSSAYDLTNTSRYYHFRLIEGVEIYGGFAGTETSINERTNFGVGESNETILSGDLNGDDVVSGSGATLTFSNYSENCYHVIYNPDPLTSASVLNGFTIKGGNGNGSNPHDRGSGICNYTASPSLINITFTANTGEYGGGICNYFASPIVTNCLIFGNKASNGAGIGNSTSSSPTFINTTIAMNIASDYGGGMNNHSNSNPTFNNCIIWGNYASTGNQAFAFVGGTCTLNYSCYSNHDNDVVAQNGSDIFIVTNNNITTDPMFIEPENGDLRINGFSSGVNNGNNSYNSESYDIRGQTRIQNSTIDIGAYEWTEGVDPAFQVIYVDLLASGSNDGSNWTDAYTSLQSALDESVSGNQIWVAKGNYHPSYDYEIGGGSRYYHFRMKKGVEIYGGFAGTETLINERTNFGLGEENETILSGDLNGDDVVSGSGETLTLSNYSENCHHVIYNPDPLTSASILNGFTVKGGNANGTDPHDRGSGICNYSTSPSLTNITLTANGGIYGGGIYNYNSSPTITNCLIYKNKTQNGAGTENKFSSPTYVNTTITMNLATAYGGGMNNYHDCEPTFNNCIVWGNNATTGNQIYASAGGTITLNYSCYSNQDNDIVMSSTTFTATNNNSTVDPLFVNAANEDFRLFGNSPAVNSGLNSYNTLLSDIRGETRIQNTTIDMGAYEWTSGLDPTTNILTWTGALSTDWNTPSNWDPAIVPSATIDALIPDMPNDPIVSMDPENPAECSNLTIQNSAVLSVAAGKALTVNGTLVNNAGNAGLFLKSDATATASLIHETSGVNATVERYIPEYAGAAGWHYISSPVGVQAIQPEFVASPTPNAGDDFYKFSEPDYLWLSVKDNSGNWNTSFENNFVTGCGYNVAYAENETKSFAGELNVGDFTFNGTTTPAITYTADGGIGWNLIGNPFASSLNWNLCSRTNIDASVYAYDGDAGQYVSWNGSIGALTDGIIPPMNAFFIKASANPELTILNSARTHAANNFYKEKSYVEDLLVLKVEGNGFSDQTFIHFNGDASNNFDSDFDAYKLSGIEEAPQLYTKAGDSKLSINVLPYSSDEIEIPLSLKVGQDTEYKISVSENTFWETVDISLKDLESGILYDLRTQTSITINHGINNSSDRFLILINGATGVEETSDENDGIEIYIFDNQIFIKTDEPGEVQVAVYNLLGQNILHRTLTDTMIKNKFF